MNLKCYDFSGIRIGVQCEKMLVEGDMLQKFSVECTKPDNLITLEFRRTLPAVPNDKTSESEWTFRSTKLEQDLPEQPFVCTEFSGSKCNMYVLDRYKQVFDIDSVFRHLPLHHLLLKNDAVILHGSYILVNGDAIVFSAPSGTGKSTQAELWRKHRNAQIINGDRVLLRRTESDFTAGGIYYSGTSGICENVTAPLRAIVLISQELQSTAVKCSGSEAFTRLFRECACSAELEKDPADTAAIIADAVNNVDIVKLGCLPDESAVEALANYLLGR